MGRPNRDRRQVVNAIRWRVRTGSPWRDMPERYGPWETAYGLFRTWQRDGVWASVLEELQARADAADIITWDVTTGSTVVPVAEAPPTAGRPRPAPTGAATPGSPGRVNPASRR